MPPQTPRPATLYERLGGRAKLAVLVRNFYASLRIHPTLGPIFAANVESWPAHHATLTDFWSLQTGGPSRYRGRLLQTHAALHLRPEHFDGWLAQWRQSCRLHFEEPEAGEMIALAESLAARMGGRARSELPNEPEAVYCRAMGALPKRYFTAEEYLLLEERAPYKSQYVAGEIFPMGESVTSDINAMGGAAPAHVKVATRIASLLDAQFEGRNCEVFCADLRVAIEPGEIYTYPDVVALCGEPKYETARQPASLLNPQLVCEVLSPSTESFDRGDKFAYYRRLESLTDYVLVSPDKMMIEHYTRQENEAWRMVILERPEHRLQFVGLNCELTLARIYERVKFLPVRLGPDAQG